MMRVRLLIALVLSALWLTSMSYGSAAQQASPSPSSSVTPEPLTKLPPSVLDAQLKSARGYSVKLSNYSGKVLVVNLWATWCGPCRSQIPALVKAYERFGFHGVEIIGLSTENPEQSVDSTGDFISEYSIPYEIGWATPELATTLMQGRDAIPQTFVVSRSGRIVKRFVGFNHKVTSRQVEEAIEEALDEKPNSAAHKEQAASEPLLSCGKGFGLCTKRPNTVPRSRTTQSRLFCAKSIARISLYGALP